MAVFLSTTYGLDISADDRLAGGAYQARQGGARLPPPRGPVEGGSVVTDIWDDAQDHRAFFESAVKPNIPAGARFEVRAIELHNTIGL